MTDLPPVQDPMIIDLFAGPGGLDVGAHWLGVPSIGIEFDYSAVQTRKNAGLSTIFGDVEQWEPKHFDARFNVLTGGPPCQTFTVAGNGHGRRALDRVIGLVDRLSDMGQIAPVIEELSPEKDRRTGLVLQPLIWALRAIENGSPYEAIMLEQVPAVKPVWETMARVLEQYDYGVNVAILGAEEYGVPQTRRRAVLMARHGATSDQINFPKPTHQKYVATHVDADLIKNEESDLPLWVSMEEVLNIGTSFRVKSNYGSGGDPKNRSRRKGNRPAFTVTGKVTRNKIEPDEGVSRGITPIEAGILQTFPRNYPWSGNDLSQQIGNAIPPRLAAHVLNVLLGLNKDVNEAAATGRIWNEPSQSLDVVKSVAEGIKRDPGNCNSSDSSVILPQGVKLRGPGTEVAMLDAFVRRGGRLAPVSARILE